MDDSIGNPLESTGTPLTPGSRRFLMNAGITDVLSDLDPADVKRFLPAANAVQKLLSEAEMGELFKVIAFSRGIPGTLDAFAVGDRSHTL